MNEVIIHLEKKTIKIEFGDFEGSINVDDICSIDYSNLYGEAVTISALLNRIGILRAEVEFDMKQKQLECNIYESDLKKRFRREAVTTQVKITEDGLKEKVISDQGYQVHKKNVFKAEKDFANIDSLYWAISSKDKKLNVLLRPVTPQEFEDGIIEGKLNGLIITKKNRVFPK